MERETVLVPVKLAGGPDSGMTVSVPEGHRAFTVIHALKDRSMPRFVPKGKVDYIPTRTIECSYTVLGDIAVYDDPAGDDI